jgi:hypothetical protein
LSRFVWDLEFLGITLQHRAVGRVRYGENVRRHFVSLDAFVPFHDFFCVNWQFLVGVDHHAEKPGIGLRKKKKTLLDVKNNPNKTKISRTT